MISDAELLENRTAMRDEQHGPRVGDYVIFPDKHLERFSHDWGDALQTSYGGSWYLGDGFASFSGALNPSVPKASLVNTGDVKLGWFWFFKGNYARAHNSLDVQAPCRVYRFSED